MLKERYLLPTYERIKLACVSTGAAPDSAKVAHLKMHNNRFCAHLISFSAFSSQFVEHKFLISFTQAYLISERVFMKCYITRISNNQNKNHRERSSFLEEKGRYRKKKEREGERLGRADRCFPTFFR